MQNITGKTITGISWNMLRFLVLSILRFTVMVVLARLIDPEFFGLLAMANIFMILIDYFSSVGISSTIIQRKNLTRTFVSLALYISIFTGFLAFIIVWFTSPYVSSFFKEPRLTNILKVFSVVLFINGFMPVGIGLLMRELKFKQLFIVDLAAYFFGYGCVSIILAAMNFKVWSLVIGVISNQVIALIFIFIFARFSFKPAFKLQEFKELFRFGKYLSTISGLNYLANISDSVIIGRFLPAANLGLYNRSSQLANLPMTSFSDTISNVMFPAYSKIQNDLKKIESWFLKSLGSVTIITIPLLIYIAINSNYIIRGLFGPNWEGAVPVLIVLSIAGIFRSSIALASPVTRSTANVFSEAWRQFIFAGILIAGGIYAVRFGIIGVSFAVLMASIWLYFSMAQVAIRILKSNWRKFIIAQLPGLLIGFIIIIINVPLNILLDSRVFEFPYILKFCIATLLCLLIYFLCIIFLPEKIKGSIPKIIITRYESRFPVFLKKFLFKNFR